MLMDMDDEQRKARAKEEPIVGGLPDAPGIVAAMRLAPGLALHLRGLADELLVNDYPGATLSRAERELIATAVSESNDCFYCMDSHGAFAAELIQRAGATPASTKLDALRDLARGVAKNARGVTRAEVERALAAGATDADTQLAVLIASAFCMYNRMVDGLRARTPPSPEAYRARAREIAEHGYSDPRVQSLPT